MNIQQLRAQIAALQDATMDENKNFRSAYDEGKFDALTAVDALLDSMQEESIEMEDLIEEAKQAQADEILSQVVEEPVSEDLEQEIINYIGFPQEVDEDISTTMIRKAAIHFAKWQEKKDESYSNDLGDYINELSKQFPEVSFAKLSRIAVRVAKWQKQQDQSTIELAEDHAMLAGMERMKEQMMKDAVDMMVGYWMPNGLMLAVDGTENCYNIDDGDRVKVIIIKED